MNEDKKTGIIDTIVRREKLRPLSRLKRLFKDPFRAFPFYILAILGHIRPFKVTFKTLWGDTMTGYLPETNTFYYYGFCEANVTSFLLRFLKPGDVVVDVGANIGFYTMLASRLVGNDGEVHSFEPTPLTYEILGENTKQLSNVVNNNWGVAEKKTEMTFDDFGPGYSAFNTASPEGTNLKRSGRKIKIGTISLDEYIQKKNIDPVFIKLDAEGYEKKILDGMTETLTKHDRPLITLEMANDALWAKNYKDSSDKLIKYGFKPYEMRDDGFTFPCTIKEHYTYDNILFVPSEKEDRIKDLIKSS